MESNSDTIHDASSTVHFETIRNGSIYQASHANTLLLNSMKPYPTSNYSHFNVIRSDKSSSEATRRMVKHPPSSPLFAGAYPDWDEKWTLPTCPRDVDGCRRNLATQPHPRVRCTCSILFGFLLFVACPLADAQIAEFA